MVYNGLPPEISSWDYTISGEHKSFYSSKKDLLHLINEQSVNACVLYNKNTVFSVIIWYLLVT